MKLSASCSCWGVCVDQRGVRHTLFTPGTIERNLIPASFSPNEVKVLRNKLRWKHIKTTNSPFPAAGEHSGCTSSQFRPQSPAGTCLRLADRAPPPVAPAAARRYRGFPQLRVKEKQTGKKNKKFGKVKIAGVKWLWVGIYSCRKQRAEVWDRSSTSLLWIIGITLGFFSTSTQVNQQAAHWTQSWVNMQPAYPVSKSQQHQINMSPAALTHSLPVRLITLKTTRQGNHSESRKNESFTSREGLHYLEAWLQSAENSSDIWWRFMSMTPNPFYLHKYKMI